MPAAATPLAKNGVKLLFITQEIDDDPTHVMARQNMALFDEYQSKENAKHVLRALKENARQGFWNDSLPLIGYRVVAAEQRGASWTILWPANIEDRLLHLSGWRKCSPRPRPPTGARRAPPRTYRRVEQACRRDRPAT